MPAVHVDLGASEPEQPHPPPLLAAETMGGNTIPIAPNMVGVSGRAELSGIAPGRYILPTMDRNGQHRRFGTGTRIDITGNTSITAENLKTTSLSGQLTFEGSARPPGQPFLRFSCGNRPFTMRILNDGTLQSAGQFLQSGHCDVALENATGFYLKSIAAGDAKPSNDSVDLIEGVDNHVVAVAAKGIMSELTGVTVQNEQPLSSAMVLLLPEDPARGSLIRRDQSDSDGTFKLSEILPGRYTLLAIDNGKDFAYRDPTAIQPYLAQGTVLEFPRQNDGPVKINVAVRRVN